MAEIKKPIQIDSPKDTSLLEIATSGPAKIGENLFSPRVEGTSEGIKQGGANLLRSFAQLSQLIGSPKNNVPSFSSQNFTAYTPQVDELSGFKSLMKDYEEAHNYTEKNYKGENLPSLYKKFAETKSPEDFNRLVDYTTNQVAKQVPQQAVTWSLAAVGVPAPLAMSVLGGAAAGGQYLEDQESASGLTEPERRQRALISGVSAAGSEGLSYGLKGAALAGKSALDAIPGIKPILAKAMAKGGSKVFQKVANALGGGPARRIISNTIINMLGEGAEEVADQAVNMMSDEAYAVRFYTLQQKLDAMIEAFGISAIASGLIGSPMIAATEIQRAVDTQQFIDLEKQAKPMMENLQERMTPQDGVNTLPTPEELFSISHIIKRFKNGLPDSRNLDNSIHVVSGDVILLEEQVDSMIQNRQWNDTQMESKLGQIGEALKNQLFDQSGNVKLGGFNEWNTNQKFKSDVQSWISGDIPAGKNLTLGSNFKSLELSGADKLPLVMNEHVLRKASEKHGINPEALTELPDSIKNPIMIFNSATVPDGLVVLTELESEGRNLVAAIHFILRVIQSIARIPFLPINCIGRRSTTPVFPANSLVYIIKNSIKLFAFLVS